jgi:hypothetical protein
MNKESTSFHADLRSGEPPDPGTQGEKEDWIGSQLRRVFDTALSEPLPDDIMSLLDRLDDAPVSGTSEIPKRR